MISVIICTYNPRKVYLEKTLDALNSQTLNYDEWELVIVDNASDQPISKTFDIRWHSNARHVYEEKLGLTNARLCGIRESIGDVLVFVDDDNILDSNYLENVVQIDRNWPMLGAWGGQCIPAFEVEPPAWTKPFWEYLGLREFEHDRWSNLNVWDTAPMGAGMCVKRIVAEQYAELVMHDSKRLKLDRRGGQLLSCGDTDLVYTAGDLGLGNGLFTSLRLQHLMPPFRLEEGYLLKLVEATAYSVIMLEFCRGVLPSMLSRKKRLRLSFPWLMAPSLYFVGSKKLKFNYALTKGRVSAMREVLNIESSLSN